MTLLITPLSDPRPLEPDWVHESDSEDFSIEWSAVYPTWNREIKRYENLEDSGSSVNSLFLAVCEALNNRRECTFTVSVHGSSVEYPQLDFPNYAIPDDTGRHWQIWNASDDDDFKNNLEEGCNNNDLLWILLQTIADSDVIQPDDTFIISISDYDPTP